MTIKRNGKDQLTRWASDYIRESDVVAVQDLILPETPEGGTVIRSRYRVDSRHWLRKDPRYRIAKLTEQPVPVFPGKPETLVDGSRVERF